jgi:hypothetical protein
MHYEKDNMKNFMTLISRGYAAMVSALALWAWYIDIKFVNSQTEHLLPNVCLAFTTLPASLTLGIMYEHWQNLFNKPLVQLTWVTMCAVLQSGTLFLLTHLLSRRNNNA